MAQELTGFGSFKNGRIGFGNVPTAVSASNEVILDSDAYNALRRGANSGKFKTTKVKNICGQVIVIKLIPNRPRNLPPLTDIILTPGRTADMVLDAYDPEQIRELRRKLKIIVDPTSR